MRSAQVYQLDCAIASIRAQRSGSDPFDTCVSTTKGVAVKRLFLDTSKATFMVTKEATEKLDGDRKQRYSKDGAPMWTVEMLAQQASEGGLVINVTVAGEKPNVASSTVVVVEDLEVIPWNTNGKHGNAFRASKIRPQQATGKAA
jgi:hypothetical protein